MSGRYAVSNERYGSVEKCLGVTSDDLPPSCRTRPRVCGQRERCRPLLAETSVLSKAVDSSGNIAVADDVVRDQLVRRNVKWTGSGADPLIAGNWVARPRCDQSKRESDERFEPITILMKHGILQVARQLLQFALR